jgi:hypothetical protein
MCTGVRVRFCVLELDLELDLCFLEGFVAWVAFAEEGC